MPAIKASMMRAVSGSRCRPSSARLRLIHARMIAVVSGCRAAYVRDKQLAAPEINEQQFFGGGKPVLNIRLWWEVDRQLSGHGIVKSCL